MSMKKSLLSDFGHAIREIRIEKSISQEQFADLCELHRTYISDVELGKRNISLENIGKMAEALEISLADLFRKVEKDESV